MNCSNCGGRLVVEETTTYPIDDTGRFFTTPHGAVMRLVCEVCRANFEYDHTPIGGGFHSISLVPYARPRPAARVYFGDKDSTFPEDKFTSDVMIGVILEEVEPKDSGYDNAFITFIPELNKPMLDEKEKEARDVGNAEG